MEDRNYITILQELKGKIQQARQRAMLAVNSELLFAYWEIGNIIVIQRKQQGWGTKIINRLIADLKAEFPDMKGLSLRNFQYMRSFAEAYPDFATIGRGGLKSTDKESFTIVQQLAAQLPWTHHQVLLDKTTTTEERLFYMREAVKNGWSRHILSHQISGKLHLRQGVTLNNFELVLSPAESDLAKETFKNPYIFDFLHASESARESDLEKALIHHIKKFILELGRGFAYVGNQYRIRVGEDDIFLDLLFFHFRLNCFIVFDLKLGTFKPEHAGKLNFYTTVVDEEVKSPEHKPTIGVLLCKGSSETMVKYSLKNINSPIGVSTFELVKDLPAELQTVMPTIEELEQEIEKEIKMHEKNTITSQPAREQTSDDNIPPSKPAKEVLSRLADRNTRSKK